MLKYCNLKFFVGAFLLLHASSAENEIQEFRLPPNLIPNNYELKLMPILDEVPGYTRFTAPGSVKITVDCNENINSVTVHILDITVTESSVSVTRVSDGQEIPITGFNYVPEYDFFIINLNEDLESGQAYDVYIEFVALIPPDRLDGMYLDFYVDPETDITHYIATTMFAANAARRAFPCFDEPGMKATFDISLAHKTEYGYHSLANPELSSTEPHESIPGWVWDHFAKSVIMPTYLVCMIVSNLDYVNAPEEPSQDTDIKLYAAYYHLDRNGGDYSANQTATVLRFFEGYYAYDYSMIKLFSIAIPQFYFTAVENWGLITYSEVGLLYFEGETTEERRYLITNVVAHEVAHQWFGNLVTCQWWSWVWLNEGFCTWVSHLGVENTYPEFAPWDQFVIRVFQEALEYDAGPNTHPIENPPLESADIGGIYDTIAYEKGASILRMMQDVMTEPVVQTALRNYVVKYEFGNANQDQLFAEFQQIVDEQSIDLPASVKEIMDTWTKQAGFPLITIRRLDVNTISLSQAKYENENATDSWWVPIRIFVFSEPEYRLVWIPAGVESVTVEIDEAEPFILNPYSVGYYRILYEEGLMPGVKNALKSASGVTKSNILDDQFAMAFDGIVELSSPLNLLNAMEHETSYVAWKTVLKRVKTLYVTTLAGQEDAKSTFVASFIPLIESAYEQVSQRGFNKGVDAMLKGELMDMACMLNSQICLREVEYMKKEIQMVDYTHLPDLQEPLLCASVRDDKNGELWSSLINQIDGKSNIRDRLLSSLACVENEDLIKKSVEKLMDAYMNDDELPTVEETRPEIFKYVLLNSEARKMATQTAMRRFNLRMTMSLSDKKRLVNLISYLNQYSTDEESLAEMDQFISRYGGQLNSEEQNILQQRVDKMKSLSNLSSRVNEITNW